MALMKLGETLGLSPNFQQLNMVKQELEKTEKGSPLTLERT